MQSEESGHARQVAGMTMDKQSMRTGTVARSIDYFQPGMPMRSSCSADPLAGRQVHNMQLDVSSHAAVQQMLRESSLTILTRLSDYLFSFLFRPLI